MIYILDKSILTTAFEHRYNRKPTTLELHMMNEHLQKNTEPLLEIVNNALVEIEIEMKPRN